MGRPINPNPINPIGDFMAKYPTPEDRASIHNRLLGYPDEIQDDMIERMDYLA